MDLMQGEYGTSITMWGEHGSYAGRVWYQHHNVGGTWTLCRVSMVPSSQCGGNMGLMQGEYGTIITMWGEHGPYAG